MGFQVFKNFSQGLVKTISFLFRKARSENVTPVKARGPERKNWIPACAGMTKYYQGLVATISYFSRELSLPATDPLFRFCPRPRKA